MNTPPLKKVKSDTIKEAEIRLQIAKIEKEIIATNAAPGFLNNLTIDMQRMRVALGGRTFLILCFALILSSLITVWFYHNQQTELTYWDLIVTQVPIATIPLMWIFRNRIKSLKGPGGLEIELEEVEVLTEDPRPKRIKKYGTLSGVDLDQLESEAYQNETSTASESSSERSR